MVQCKNGQFKIIFNFEIDKINLIFRLESQLISWRMERMHGRLPKSTSIVRMIPPTVYKIGSFCFADQYDIDN